ncbi:hypothetical protein C7S15_0181 [Burkholderia cepacia]|nr:hypothetical protein [Burkholderia cepacia]
MTGGHHARGIRKTRAARQALSRRRLFEPSPRPIGELGNPVHGASPIPNIVIPAKQATRHSIYCASMRHVPIQT